MASAEDTIQAKPIGVMIDEMFMLRERKRQLEAEIKGINSQLSESEMELIAALDGACAAGARGHFATASVTETIVPQVEDWDRFVAFVRRYNKFELLERRPSAAAFRELAAQRRDGTVPGLMPYMKRSLSLKKVA